MAVPPIVNATLQSAVLSATSNLIAQVLTSYQSNEPFILDWVPVVQFTIWAIVNTPYNYLWQDYLEQTFPAYDKPPQQSGKGAKSSAAGDRKLNVKNTLVKTLLDQTIGSVVNTFLFALFVSSLQEAMQRPEHWAHPSKSAAFLLSGSAIDYSRVDWDAIFARVRREFFPILVAGWRLWPLVSLVNFAFITSIQGRNLVASVAGIGWGVYMSLLASRGSDS
ncbi:hypothetical protein SODALDRAFT_325174 [Sodiomyces alkalinus F11]|uniref:Mpv17/PMP22 family protein n=1 Tax=Sodiomyces alkalinus (strain CBS 110278 / VKM F-3762 / F11) TaxID=1314773 RepID=A0A3N2PSW3_SODAK|nr:hypothetical protein SODALDRAFT_325174 [Sodiomyces alkalinus F11]ROT37609.1 hypothetical protein SODALDRAFT_325174 [Sodiomyces alkalinus F11]